MEYNGFPPKNLIYPYCTFNIMKTMWIKKYAPRLPEHVPQENAVKQLDNFINNFRKLKKRAALIYGPPGSCKTCSVHALAEKNNFEVVEVNASDVRNKDGINSLLGAALKQQSLFSKGKIILVDEVDGVSGMQDRGGVSAIASLIKDAFFPIIMTANNSLDG